MISEDIRTYLARLFLGKTKVHSLRPQGKEVVLRTTGRVIETHPLRSPERVLGSALFGSAMDVLTKGFCISEAAIGGIRDNIRGGKFSFDRRLVVNGERVVRDTRVFLHSIGGFTVRCNKAVGRISPLPIEVRNRLPWFRGRSNSLKKGEVLLALYCPILEDGVLKSVLNKERGTLLVWYNPRRAWKARSLFLVRDFSSGGSLEWKWIDIH